MATISVETLKLVSKTYQLAYELNAAQHNADPANHVFSAAHCLLVDCLGKDLADLVHETVLATDEYSVSELQRHLKDNS